MSELDIRLLKSEDLPKEAFPGGRNEPFRVFFTPEVHAGLWKHAREDTWVEICGVLVGPGTATRSGRSSRSRSRSAARGPRPSSPR